MANSESTPMSGVLARISQSGRISIPAKFRKAVGLERGGEVVVELDGREIRIRTGDEVVGRAQTLTRRLLGDNPDASVDAFLAERRREAARELPWRFSMLPLFWPCCSANRVVKRFVPFSPHLH